MGRDSDPHKLNALRDVSYQGHTQARLTQSVNHELPFEIRKAATLKTSISSGPSVYTHIQTPPPPFFPSLPLPAPSAFNIVALLLLNNSASHMATDPAMETPMSPVGAEVPANRTEAATGLVILYEQSQERLGRED